MPTPTYTDLASSKPDGADSPTTFSADALANIRALRDQAITGRVAGFVQSRTTGAGPDASRPQYITWMNSGLGIGFRTNATWGGTGNVRITSLLWEWSNDTGATWASMGSAQANTFDSDDNITATTNSGGAFTIVLEIWAKVLRAVSNLAAHIAGTGTGVHGLGTMSTQAASAVAITGGTINGAAIGGTTAAAVDATRVREDFHDYGAIAAGGTVTLELDKYAGFAFTPHATTSNTVTIAVSGAPAAGKIAAYQLEIINGQRSADAKITYPAAARWVQGSGARPVDTALELSGRNLFTLTTRDGGARLEFSHLGKGG